MREQCFLTAAIQNMKRLAIRKITNSLTEMLKNPSLTEHVRTLLENAQSVAQTEKNMIENLFSQYGGGLE